MNTLIPSKSNEELLAALGAGLPEVEVTNSDTSNSLVEPSNHYSPGVSSSVEERALSLLGSGVAAESVASALGVTPSRISQMLAEKSFSQKVAALRYETLQSHNKRDSRYNTLEDRLIKKLESSLPLLVRPESILKAITVVNGAKRRGQSTPTQTNNQNNVVNLILPSIIVDKFTVAVNIENQVTKAGGQELLTMPSGNLLKQVEEATEALEADRRE